MSEWRDMQKKPNTDLQDLLKSKKAKTRKPSELSKTAEDRNWTINIVNGQAWKRGGIE